jgi:hypothetical protein
MCFYIRRAVVIQEEPICESRPFELGIAQLTSGCLLEWINGRSGIDDEALQGQAHGAQRVSTYPLFGNAPQPEAMNRCTDEDCPAALMRLICDVDEASSATEIVTYNCVYTTLSQDFGYGSYVAIVHDDKLEVCRT